MERFVKTLNGFQPVTFFAKHSILDVWQGFEYASKFIENKISSIHLFIYSSTLAEWKSF